MANPVILILCTGNSARSQMAEGLLKHICRRAYDIHSAGTNPSVVRPEAIAAMSEIGLDISGQTSKSVDEFAERAIDYVLTVCDNAKETCPHFPGATRVDHKAFEDPAAIEGSPDDVLAAFRNARDAINQYFADEYLEIIGWSAPDVDAVTSSGQS